MKRFAIIGLALSLSALVLTACASAEERAVRQVVVDAESAFENALNGKSNVAALDEDFATTAEGAIPAGLAETRDQWKKLLNDHVSGVSIVQISNFRITSISVHESGNLARVTFQMDVRIVHGTLQGSGTWTQDFALIKTATRGWRISGGDARRWSDVVGTLPQ